MNHRRVVDRPYADADIEIIACVAVSVVYRISKTVRFIAVFVRLIENGLPAVGDPYRSVIRFRYGRNSQVRRAVHVVVCQHVKFCFNILHHFKRIVAAGGHVVDGTDRDLKRSCSRFVFRVLNGQCDRRFSESVRRGNDLDRAFAAVRIGLRRGNYDIGEREKRFVARANKNA